MARGRFLDKRITQDMRFTRVSTNAYLVYLCITPHLDVEGKMGGEPLVVRNIACGLHPDVFDLMASRDILVSPEKQTIEVTTDDDLPDDVPEGYTYEDIRALHLCSYALSNLWHVHRAMGRSVGDLVQRLEQCYEVDTDTIE